MADEMMEAVVYDDAAEEAKFLENRKKKIPMQTAG